ncbi:MAG: EcsC family protein [Deltaproteobacteria bacterium]|nr:EcsC family protein [Deltaproteobacteria bacterium]
MANTAMSSEDLADLRYAKSLLENPSLAARIANVLGTPIEIAIERMPEGAREIIGIATTKSLETALDFAISTMDDRRHDSTNLAHKILVAATGAAGGAFGLPALTIELPISTIIMLRSIAVIARSEGERIKMPEAKLACLEVFALGGRTRGDDATESSYFAVRAFLAKALAEAAEYIAERGAAKGTALPLMRFITQVAARFGVPVSEKALAQSLPIVGAAGGALINTLFIDHFQDVGRGHFIVRRLERAYDPDLVRREYLNLQSK